ncbi:hypothetical protein BMS3Bbin04_00890 [bacterium BMS3Bbin04]|nr:hypothetical protein BMS3Bbin04_00890 [bacterium BMS3Bbin04]
MFDNSNFVNMVSNRCAKMRCGLVSSEYIRDNESQREIELHLILCVWHSYADMAASCLHIWQASVVLAEGGEFVSGGGWERHSISGRV